MLVYDATQKKAMKKRYIRCLFIYRGFNIFSFYVICSVSIKKKHKISLISLEKKK